MKVNRKLNLVIELHRDHGQIVYVHSTPIARQVFESFFMVIAKTFSSIYTGGIGIASGPAIAAMLLKKNAQDIGGEGYLAEVNAGLIEEVHRLTSVVVLGENGWENIPFAEACKKQLIDDDERGEVENALAFFTVASCMHRKEHLPGVLGTACELWGARVVSSNCTEFATSLPTSTSKENTGAKVTA